MKKIVCLIDQDYFGIKSKESPTDYFELLRKSAELIHADVEQNLGKFLFCFNKKRVYYTLAPNWRILLCIIFGAKIIWINFQYPRESSGILGWIRNLKLRFYLKAVGVFVTQDAGLQHLYGIRPIYLPTHVDTNFFSCRHAARLKKYDYVIPGDAEREMGILNEVFFEKKIARISRNKEQLLGDNIDYFYRVDFIEYRDVIGLSKMGILPLKKSNHMAGQTALLEMLAMGLPVFISDGYTYQMYKNYPGVYDLTEVESNVKEVDTLGGLKSHTVKSVSHDLSLIIKNI